MTRGPAPKPTAIKLAEGNRGKRRQKSEPQPRPVWPPMPAFVKDTKGAAEHWRRLCPILDRMGVLTEADGDDLAFYCIELATYAHCNRMVKLHGLTQTTDKGWSAPSAWATRRDSALLNCSRIGAKFGLSPADRTKIEVKPPDAKQADPVAEVIAITRRPKAV